MAEFAFGAAALAKGVAKFAARRAASAGVNLASPTRTRHILYGDACTQLYEYDIGITENLYAIVEQTGQAMNLDTGQWSYLRELVG
ncbi:MAG: hypothetical protein MJE77_20015 [Proteobacteria bacterium]|nr:hypothetical protein [Pseudomonadota bacterium]